MHTCLSSCLQGFHHRLNSTSAILGNTKEQFQQIAISNLLGTSVYTWLVCHLQLVNLMSCMSDAILFLPGDASKQLSSLWEATRWKISLCSWSYITSLSLTKKKIKFLIHHYFSWRILHIYSKGTINNKELAQSHIFCIKKNIATRKIQRSFLKNVVNSEIMIKHPYLKVKVIFCN